MVKYSLTICTGVRFFTDHTDRTKLTENGFTNRSNRTVREKDSQVVNTALQSFKESGCE